MDDEELMKIIIQGFLTDIPKQIQALKEFMGTADIVATERQAHTIKGASANISADRLRAAAYELEKAAKAKHWTDMNRLVTEVENQFDRLKEEIQQEKK